MPKQVTVALDVRRKRRRATRGVLMLCCTLAMLPLACGGDDDSSSDSNDQEILDEALKEFGEPVVVLLDTTALAQAVRAGQQIQLPFRRQGAGVVEREVQLTLRNLRSPDLTELVLKDGVAGSGSTMPLPPPATYQGKVRDGGTAVFTITDAIVEGSMLVAPDGWAFIEPLEPQLRFHNVAPAERERLLRKYNHIVYNARDALGSVSGGDDTTTASSVPVGPPQPPVPLVLSMVADGDVELLRAYPLDSLMPFWLKQETILNAVDWLYNCIEPDGNADNAYANCGNDFDGGNSFFQARVRIDRFEVWKTGGPDAPTRGPLLMQSTSMTHQASPPCCGLPHTAGRSDLVHFFSGKQLRGGSGYATVGGLSYYGPRCEDPSAGTALCHHAVSQIVPSSEFRGTAFHQQSLVAHEIGHNNNAEETNFGQAKLVCWLFDEECADALMLSDNGFNGRNLFLYYSRDAEEMMGPLLRQQLQPAPSTP